MTFFMRGSKVIDSNTGLEWHQSVSPERLCASLNLTEPVTEETELMTPDISDPEVPNEPE